jgi:transcriptional regulator with GAF, ATPase, and Fis domain
MSTAPQRSTRLTDLPPVLIATGNSAIRTHVTRLLREWQWPMFEASGGADAISKLESTDCRVLLLDEQLPDINASDVTSLVGDRFPGVDVLMLDRQTGLPMRGDPPKREETQNLLRVLCPEEHHASDDASTQAGTSAVPENLPGMIGQSTAMKRVYRHTRLVAPRTTPVLLMGESGTGKELVARSVHALSARADKPFMTINCAAIPESLLEAELFGYVRGAFTGAAQNRIGRIHAAQGGTLFLDEIGDMPLSLQAKILRFLEQGEVQRLGSSDVFTVDVRVVAATNADLDARVAAREFRTDLYYRLAVFPIELPKLAQREGDIALLAREFLASMAGSCVTLSEAAMKMLERHAWPGNVRELRHVIERAVILAGSATCILPEHIILRASAN